MNNLACLDPGIGVGPEFMAEKYTHGLMSG
jgi:hypothetical protein